MALTAAEVKKLAQLARITLTPDEQARYAETISAVLDYMKILNEVDTKNIEPTFQVTGLKDVWREDIAKDSKIIKELIEQMPRREDEELLVPGVFDNQDN
jgi:aspartyl-tRNA(Asn)/glutamyl-tRNA(Gln) amidotransferase subunit C